MREQPPDHDGLIEQLRTLAADPWDVGRDDQSREA
jgi:hypothetical protein